MNLDEILTAHDLSPRFIVHCSFHERKKYSAELFVADMIAKTDIADIAKHEFNLHNIRKQN